MSKFKLLKREPFGAIASIKKYCRKLGDHTGGALGVLVFLKGYHQKRPKGPLPAKHIKNPGKLVIICDQHVLGKLQKLAQVSPTAEMPGAESPEPCMLATPEVSRFGSWRKVFAWLSLGFTFFPFLLFVV